MPGKKNTFTTRVDAESPPYKTLKIQDLVINGGGAGYRPRVRFAYSIDRLLP